MNDNLISRFKHNRDWYRHLIILVAPVVFTLLFSSGVLAAGEYAVFTLNSDFEPLSHSKARSLYRGKAKSLQGKRIELCDWPQTSKQRSEFYQYLLGKDLAQMNAYWASLSFAGKARPPKEINNNSIEALISWMQARPNRIGYAPLNSLPEGAKVLYIVSKEHQQ